MFGGWHNVERFGVKLLDLVKYYCSFPVWWMQYDPPTFSFVPSPFVTEYFSGVEMRGFAADQTRIWTMVLTEYIFMSEEMFIVNTRDGVCATYYTGSLQFGHVSGGLLFWLPGKIADALA